MRQFYSAEKCCFLFFCFLRCDQSLMLFIRMAATLFVQPLDLVKNRMQLSGKKRCFVFAMSSNNVSRAWRGKYIVLSYNV